MTTRPVPCFTACLRTEMWKSVLAASRIVTVRKALLCSFSNSTAVTIYINVKSCCKMPFIFSHPEYGDKIPFTDFATAVHAFLLKITEDVFSVERLQVKKNLLMFTEPCVKLVHFHVFYTSRAKWKGVLTNVNVQENIRKMVKHHPRLSTLRITNRNSVRICSVAITK
jgi:hypothetical protein